MSMSDRILRSRRVVLPDGVRPAEVVIRNGLIAEVRDVPAEGSPASEGPVIDLGELALLPALVDCHAHINEPGRTEWEGFETATRAAAAGGIGMVVDMPLNSIPATTTREALQVKAREAEGHCAVDYGFWGGVVPGNASELEPMVKAGARGFKCFLVHSGVDEFPMATRADLDEAMPVLARLGVPLLVHAELEGPPEAATGADARRYDTYLRSRPATWEVEAIRMMIDLCRKHRCRVHIVHLSAADALADIARAKAEGLPFTVETCPHYLTFCAEEIAEGATHFKCAPPIRGQENRERLWDAVRTGVIDFIVSDHSPCTPVLKRMEEGDFAAAWGGISSIQFSLPAVWAGMRERGLGLRDLVHRMCERTADFAGVGDRRGRIAVGQEANLVVFDPDALVSPAVADVLHRHPLTPYEGRALRGRVVSTLLRGEAVYEQGRFAEGPLKGRWV